MDEDLIGRLRKGCVYYELWCDIDERATDALLREACDEIERLNSELVRIRKIDSKAFASWLKRKAALQDEIDCWRAQLVRTGEAWENLSTLPSAPGNVQGSARIFADEISALLKRFDS